MRNGRKLMEKKRRRKTCRQKKEGIKKLNQLVKTGRKSEGNRQIYLLHAEQ
jgi:hypothetical protein